MSDLKVGKFNVISEEFHSGEGCEIGNFNTIGDASIGNNVVIENNCVIGSGCVIGDNTHVRSFVELRPNTIIGDNCYLDSYFHSSGTNKVGNNVTLRFNSCLAREVTVDDDVYICPNVMTNYGHHTGKKVGATHIGRGAFIGTATVINYGIKIAPETVVGSCSFVTKDLDKGIYIGIPAKRLKKD